MVREGPIIREYQEEQHSRGWEQPVQKPEAGPCLECWECREEMLWGLRSLEERPRA